MARPPNEAPTPMTAFAPVEGRKEGGGGLAVDEAEAVENVDERVVDVVRADVPNVEDTDDEKLTDQIIDEEVVGGTLEDVVIVVDATDLLVLLNYILTI